MDAAFWAQMLIPVVITALLQEVRWRRRRRVERKSQRLATYERLLVVSDLSFSAAQEFARLQKGLHWWNGRPRLQQLRAVHLDDRFLQLTEEIAGAVGAVRLHGTAEAVVAAEEVLAAVAAPLTDDVTEEEALANLSNARTRFVELTRHEAGLEPLPERRHSD